MAIWITFWITGQTRVKLYRTNFRFWRMSATEQSLFVSSYFVLSIQINKITDLDKLVC